MAKNSAIGPRTSAGKNVSAPTIRMVASQNTPNMTVWVRRVLVVGAAVGLRATEPATAMRKIIGGYRPIKITAAVARLNQAVLELSPAKAETLSAAPEAKA